MLQEMQFPTLTSGQTAKRETRDAAQKPSERLRLEVNRGRSAAPSLLEALLGRRSGESSLQVSFLVNWEAGEIRAQGAWQTRQILCEQSSILAFRD